MLARSLTTIALIFPPFEMQRYLLFRENHRIWVVCPGRSGWEHTTTVTVVLLEHLRPLRGFPRTQNQPAVFRTLLRISHCLRHSPKCQSWALFDCSFPFFLRAGWAPGVSLVRSIKVNGDTFTHMGWRPNLQKNSRVSAVRLWHSLDVLMAFNGQLNDCYYPFVLLNRTLWTCLCMAL